MKYIDASFPSPAENLACDEALLDLCEEGAEDEILRFWEPDRLFVVLGYTNHAVVEANIAACEAGSIPVLRRLTGGGTVLQGPGCLNYTLILRIPESGPLSTITGTNRYILQRQIAALQPLLPAPVRIQGHTDLTVAAGAAALKFSGNAQRRRRKCLIFHGTFLLRFELALIARYLNMPSKQPDYRENRPHVEFVTNVPLTPDALKRALQSIWSATVPLAPLPINEISRLARDKYSKPDWNLRL